MARKELSVKQANKLIETWQGQYEDYQYSQRLASRFQAAAPADVARMWEAGTNEKGKPLSSFELAALAERWGQIHDCLPPCDDAEPAAATTGPQTKPADDAVLSPRQTARLADVSLSTLKSRMQDGSFPRPLRLSRRRVGWVSRDVREWVLSARTLGIDPHGV
jgi:predicted DNA-binding transcriptional regulator AlpA